MCRYAAVRLFKERYKSLVQAFELSKKSDSFSPFTSILRVTYNFSFILLFWIFNDILGITKLLSETLQSKELDLARAIDLVESVQKILTERLCQEYFHNKIWLNTVKDAGESNVDVDSTQRKRQSETPSH